MFQRQIPPALKWQRLTLTKSEETMLRKILVQFVPAHRTRLEWKDGFGSGFIVGTHRNRIFVFTAAHVLVDAADLILGTEPRSALDHLETPGERATRRLQPLFQSASIRAVVNLGAGPEVLRIVDACIPPDYKKADTALVLLDVPPLSYSPSVGPIAIDVGPILGGPPVVAVGFRSIRVHREDTGGEVALRTTAEIEARAGYVSVEHGTRLVETDLERLSMPTLPGQSGGPVLVNRTVSSDLIALPRGHMQTTAVAILSHDASSTEASKSEAIEGASYASPVLQAYIHSFKGPDGTEVSVAGAIEAGWIETFGDHARHVLVEKDPPGKRKGFYIRVAK